jgi:hypothetical protein
MKKAIWATYYHRISTDTNPQHHLCPDGPDTWCKYKKDPTSYKHHDAIPSTIADVIKPCYDELTNDALLSKCLHGGTSNANESFNNLLWRLAPKSEFSGLPTLELATYLSVLHYNDGAGAVLRTLSAAGVGREVGEHAVAAVKKRDEARVRDMEYQQQQLRVKKRRYILKKMRKKKQHAAVAREGVTYGAGQF